MKREPRSSATWVPACGATAGRIAGACVIAFAALAAMRPGCAAAAPGTVRVRLVVADANATEPSAPDALRDVLPILQKFRLGAFRLVSSQRLTLVGGSEAALAHGFVVRVGGVDPAGRFTVTVLHRDKPLVQQNIWVMPDHPVVLGGLPAVRDGQVILIFSLP